MSQATEPAGLRERVRTLVESQAFDTAIIGLVIANALTLGVETSSAMMARYGGPLHVFDRFALGVFVVELLGLGGRQALDPTPVLSLIQYG